jgi:hypothetical protein
VIFHALIVIPAKAHCCPGKLSTGLIGPLPCTQGRGISGALPNVTLNKLFESLVAWICANALHRNAILIACAYLPGQQWAEAE